MDNEQAGLQENSRPQSHRTVWGVVILAVGILFLLQNLFPKISFRLFWPIILIVIGLAILFSGSRRAK